jgi:hypothetical protein
MKDSLKAQTAIDWRELGFWYDYTPQSGWIIRGSKSGIERLASLLEAYSRNPRNAPISEHDHFGPYIYLKFVTWSSPEINSDGFYGSLLDLSRLAELIRKQLAIAHSANSIELATLYSPSSTSALTINIEDETFDPASADAELK